MSASIDPGEWRTAASGHRHLYRLIGGVRVTSSLSGVRSPGRARAVLAALALALAVPANAVGATGFQTSNLSMVASSGMVADVQFVPLINVGEAPFGDDL